MLAAFLLLSLAPIQDPVPITWQKTDGWVAQDGILSNSGTNPVHLFSNQEFQDSQIHVEFKIPKGSNSGVYVHGRYEVQILDSSGIADKNMSVHDCGAIYERWKDDQGFEGTPPLSNAFAGPDLWNVYDIKFQAPQFDANGGKLKNARFVEVRLNGTIIHKNVEVTGPTRAGFFETESMKGPIVLQGDHGPVSYRNVWVRPLIIPTPD